MEECSAAKQILDQDAVTIDEVNYLSYLGEKNLAALTKESQRLTNAENDVTQQFKDLAVNNYQVFIDTSANTHHILEEFQTIQDKVEKLSGKFPELQENCNVFLNETKGTHRGSMSLTFKKINEIADFLELPNLINQCILNENYHDALILIKHVRKIVYKNGKIGILAVIQKEIDKLWIIIVQNLLNTLREDVELPKCLQIVGYLRTMNVFSQAELRLKFLQSRNTWMQSMLGKIPNDNGSEHLNQTIIQTRHHLFQIVTQYNAIFNDDRGNFFDNDSNVNESIIFQSWIAEKINQLLQTLEKDLKNCEISSFNYILTQCMYFGISCNRVGCDFRSLIAPMLLNSLVSHFCRAIESNTAKFREIIGKFTLINKVYATSIEPSVENNAEREAQTHIRHFYPLAHYCNGFLSAFNDIRGVIALAIMNEIHVAVQKSLITAGEVILVFFQQEHQAFDESAKQQFDYFCKCFAFYLVPYLQTCLKSLISQQQIATHLGVNVQFVSSKSLVTLDKSQILKPIMHFLPTVVDVDLNNDIVNQQ